jgi:hypothetical protein
MPRILDEKLNLCEKIFGDVSRIQVADPVQEEQGVVPLRFLSKKKQQRLHEFGRHGGTKLDSRMDGDGSQMRIRISKKGNHDRRWRGNM